MAGTGPSCCSINPYRTFLDSIGDGDDYSIRLALDSWLEALGPLTMPRSLCGKERCQPWTPQPREDVEDISIQETVNKVAKSFCSWLRKLPGSESTEQPHWNENDIKKMFDIFNKTNEKNPGKVRPVKNWTKFGTSIKLVDKTFKKKVDSSKNISLFQVEPQASEGEHRDVANAGEQKVLTGVVNKNSSESRRRYGAYYLDPNTWGKTKPRKKEFLKPTSRLEGKNITTRSFEKYLKSSQQFNSKFLKEILQ